MEFGEATKTPRPVSQMSVPSCATTKEKPLSCTADASVIFSSPTDLKVNELHWGLKQVVVNHQRVAKQIDEIGLLKGHCQRGADKLQALARKRALGVDKLPPHFGHRCADEELKEGGGLRSPG